jgi:AraC family transcriptional regulator, regulatory protein of adaptative response / DNA-3-methyladenine glycosylase II
MSENGWLSAARQRIVGAMTAATTLERSSLYKALSARDRRFDGLFFVGVTSTAIYCRPICPARTPKAANCRFFDSAQQAEQAGFRPCLRCRPELAPGDAPIDDGPRIARLMIQRLEDGTLEGEAGIEAVADQFELSSRQMRRIIQKELGVPPIQLLLTRRLLLAKQLLTETALPITEIAFASGFSSLRRFNDAFVTRYAMPPTRLRRTANGDATAAVDASGTSVLQLAYRPPYDWTGTLAFLRARALAGVEHVTGDAYARTVRLKGATGWIRVTRSPQHHVLRLEFTHGLTPVLPSLIGRIRALFDLDARPDVIAAHLRGDPRLRAAVTANPGRRLPGAFDGFELGLRAILGQQITVKGATTIGSRFVSAFGEPFATPFPELRYLTPTAARVATATRDAIARHGIVASRARSIIALAAAQHGGDLSLDNGGSATADRCIHRLTQLPGIGPWTAHYIAMRALRWPDAFPKEDVAVRKALGGVSATEAERISQRWRPWRGYAVMHLWASARTQDTPYNSLLAGLDRTNRE